MSRCALYEIHNPDTLRSPSIGLAMTMMRLTAIVVLTCASLAVCLMPIELTDETFSSTVEEGNPVFVKFYAPWCGHCKRLAPTWDDLSSHYENSDITIAKVDCTKFSKVCGDEQVRGYPTLKLFHNGGVVKYEGARDLKSFTNFVDDHISQAPDETATKESDVNIDEMGVMHLNDGNFDSITSKGVHFVKFYAPWCGHCQKLAPTWSDLAAYYNTHNKDVHIVKVDCTENSATCPKYDVRSYPTLILLQDGKVKAQYTGKRDLIDLIQFVTSTLNEQPQAQASVPQVRVLTGADFNDVISAGTTFVKFYAPWCGHCKRLAPTWDQLAEISHSKTGITIAKVDCTVEKELCETHQVRGYPTLILFKDGSKKADYSGPRDIESLLGFLEN